MMLVTKEEFLMAAFSLRVQEICRAHNICFASLNPKIVPTLWMRMAAEKKLIVIDVTEPPIMDITTFDT